MPYKSNKDLPDTVRNVLPPHAQDIYREAFNHAIEEYQNPKTRQNSNEPSEQVAHKVAWAAVKKKYHKVGNKWHEIKG